MFLQMVDMDLPWGKRETNNSHILSAYYLQGALPSVFHLILTIAL